MNIVNGSRPTEQIVIGMRPFDLLMECNRTDTPYPRESCIHQLFEAQTLQSPDAVALVVQDRSITYSELNRRSNQLAHALQRLGIGPDRLVAVSMDRSPEMIVALLGILKAGAAYLPLDDYAPTERIRLILEDAGASVIVTQESRSKLLQEARVKTLRLDADWPIVDSEPDVNPICLVSANNLAYVLFTSGSTGTPKGVMVDHRAVVRLVRNTDYVRLNADETLLQMAPLAFDASTFEIWGALLNGARLAIMPASTPTPAEIGQQVDLNGVTTLWLTAGLFHQVVDGQLDSLRGVRQLLAGGDVLDVARARRLTRELPECRLINGYGPTECTTFSCCCSLDARMLSNGTAPIGRPIANTHAYILDTLLAPAPIGTPGELFIGGDGLARGYLNRAELTADKFLPDPFQAQAGSRMYQTGDMAQYLPDGTIDFLGRIDNQVKIRGYRIELEEIGAALLQHPCIGSACVVAQCRQEDGKRLEAFVTTCKQPAPTTLELRWFLKTRLPDYMIPALYWLVPNLPLNANGKVDRAALTAGPAERLSSGIAFAAPRNEWERVIATAWQDVLELEAVGLDESFYDIGGDSLRIVQLHAILEATTGSTIPLTALFQYPTIRTFAKYVHQDLTYPDRATAVNQPALQAGANDRAARQRQAQVRWKQIAKGSRKDG